MTTISSLSWIRKGIAAPTPERYKLTDEEYERVASLVGAQLAEAQIADKNVEQDDVEADDIADENEDIEAVAENKDDLSIYKLDTYDEEQEADLKRTDIPLFSNVKGLAYYSSNKEDPYVKFADEDEEAEEVEELAIAPTDNLILAAKTEDDISHVEIYLYETGEDNLYVHHDILLPSFPLCVEWVGCRIGRKAAKEGFGNYAAIGSFETSIEIWDLDLVDAVYPEVILGERPKDKAPTKRNRANPDRHVDAVLSLAWNMSAPAFLVSGSADHTIKLWDLSTVTSAISTPITPEQPEPTVVKALRSFSLHTAPVSSLAWSPTTPTILASGGHDSRVFVFDVREPQNAKSWNVGSDVECIAWDKSTGYLIVGLEDGRVLCFDVEKGGSVVNAESTADLKKAEKSKKSGRKGASAQVPANGGVGAQDTPVWTIHAHDGPASSVDMSQLVNGCLLTGGGDKMVKIWSIKDNTASLITSKDLGVGKVFACKFCPDSPHLISAAGSKGRVVIWNLSDNFGMKRAFGSVASAMRNSEAPPTPRKEVTSIDDEGEPDEDEDEYEDDEEGGDDGEEGVTSMDVDEEMDED
ncbi:hypothetical protein SmJEL517_g04712 [Synchytrium microbalum]|uniref:Anaphase-promoting complex subunit 4 WD40 domain-containing protein n=1 Tax=Synchytrium microbalum TaxID=1806994 RepID=A0A507BYF4_9FUNG|nr:uncharacterized protein SmJEL517_g04712 [Synchytrium microbalum]TPX32158.1 hypothetical protein SmJEL517_g04712 [Synchytrium microbalum]